MPGIERDVSLQGRSLPVARWNVWKTVLLARIAADAALSPAGTESRFPSSDARINK